MFCGRQSLGTLGLAQWVWRRDGGYGWPRHPGLPRSGTGRPEPWSGSEANSKRWIWHHSRGAGHWEGKGKGYYSLHYPGSLPMGWLRDGRVPWLKEVTAPLRVDRSRDYPFKVLAVAWAPPPLAGSSHSSSPLTPPQALLRPARTFGNSLFPEPASNYSNLHSSSVSFGNPG